MTERRLGRFAQYLVAGALRYPDSALQWRLIYVFFRNLPLPLSAAEHLRQIHAEEHADLICETVGAALIVLLSISIYTQLPSPAEYGIYALIASGMPTADRVI